MQYDLVDVKMYAFNHTIKWEELNQIQVNYLE